MTTPEMTLLCSSLQGIRHASFVFDCGFCHLGSLWKIRLPPIYGLKHATLGDHWQGGGGLRSVIFRNFAIFRKFPQFSAIFRNFSQLVSSPPPPPGHWCLVRSSAQCVLRTAGVCCVCVCVCVGSMSIVIR